MQGPPRSARTACSHAPPRIYHAPPCACTLQVLYLWGEEKNTMFHTTEAVDLLNATEGSSAAAVPDAAHYLHLQQPDAVWAKVRPFVLGTGATGPSSR